MTAPLSPLRQPERTYPARRPPRTDRDEIGGRRADVLRPSKPRAWALVLLTGLCLWALAGWIFWVVLS